MSLRDDAFLSLKRYVYPMRDEIGAIQRRIFLHEKEKSNEYQISLFIQPPGSENLVGRDEHEYVNGSRKWLVFTARAGQETIVQEAESLSKILSEQGS